MAAKHKIVGHIGDSSPLDYGGGVILKHRETGNYFLIYTPGLSDDDDDDADLAYYVVSLPSDYEDLKSRLDWVDFPAVLKSIGMSRSDFASQLANIRRARDNTAAMEYAELFNTVADYYGWSDLGADEQTASRKELERRFKGLPPS